MRADRAKAKPRAMGQSSHPMMIGVFIGVLLGLCLALGVALYLNKAPKPFVGREPAGDAAAKTEPAPQKSVPKFEPVKPDSPKPGAQAAAPPSQPSKPPEPKTRFDFYKILPGEEAVTGNELGQGAAQGAGSRTVYYLQAGAFQKSSDADNLKARLALAGMEAQIQTATLPDSSIWHRVRLGPYGNAQELDKAQNMLKLNKIDGAVIKVNEPLAKP